MFKNPSYQIKKRKQNNHPQSVLPVLVMIDISNSMNSTISNANIRRTRIEVANQALKTLYETIKRDTLLSTSVDLSLIAFNNDIHKLRSFNMISNNEKAPTLTAEGTTLMGEAIIEACQITNKRVQELRDKALSHTLTPVILIISDGRPEHSDQQAMERAKSMCLEAKRNKSFNMIPIYIDNKGETANNYLENIGSKAIHIEDSQIEDLLGNCLANACASSLTNQSTDSFAQLLETAMTWSEILKK